MAEGDIHEQYKNRTSSYLIRIPCISHSISFHMLLLRSRLGVGGKVSQEIFKWNFCLVGDRLQANIERRVLSCELFTWKQCIFASLGQRSWSGKGKRKRASFTEVGRCHKEMPDAAGTLGWEMHCTQVSGRWRQMSRLLLHTQHFTNTWRETLRAVEEVLLHRAENAMATKLLKFPYL